jgi:hypothetical protein
MNPLSSDAHFIIRREIVASEPYYWTEVASVQSSSFVDTYSETVPTLFDSTESSAEYHYFQIIAHESEPTAFWISEIDSGYSVDNLAPCAPLCLAGEQSYMPEGLGLSWTPNVEIDLDLYRVYRGTDPGFTPGPGNLLTSQCDTSYFDSGWRWDGNYCYKVAAVDIHGNEGPYSSLCSDQITGTDEPQVPTASFLSQNHPNPFNPVTTIRFGIEKQVHVSLRIYDAAGRLVHILVDRSIEAGRYEAVWNGQDDAGRYVASGVYFYCLSAGDFEQTRKMVLLR